MYNRHFYRLAQPTISHLFDFVVGTKDLKSWFALAVCDHSLMRLAYSAISLKVRDAKYDDFRFFLHNSCLREMDQLKRKKASPHQELATAKYFLWLGEDPYSLMMTASEKGHLLTLTYLYHQGFNFWKSGFEAPLIAAFHNQPKVIELCHELNIDLLRSRDEQSQFSVAQKAIEYGSSDVILALGQTGFDFNHKSFDYSESYLQQALAFKLSETPEELNKRYELFLNMLKSGSFPKEGRKDFLAWLDKHFEKVKPYFSDVMLMIGFTVSLEYISSESEKSAQLHQLQLNYPPFREKISLALAHYEVVHRNMCKGVEKTRCGVTEKKRFHGEDQNPSVELMSLPMCISFFSSKNKIKKQESKESKLEQKSLAAPDF